MALWHPDFHRDRLRRTTELYYKLTPSPLCTESRAVRHGYETIMLEDPAGMKNSELSTPTTAKKGDTVYNKPTLFKMGIKKLYMNYKKILAALILVSCLLFFFTNSYSQNTDWERVRREREAKEARDRQDSKFQEQQIKNSLNSKPTSSNKASVNEDVVYEYINKTSDLNGLKIMKLNELFGLLNSKTEVVPPIYFSIYPFSGKFYCVQGTDPKNNRLKKIGFIDRYGKIIIPLQFDQLISDFKNGRATVVLNNERFEIDESGELVGIKTIHIVPLTAIELQKEANQRVVEIFALAINNFENKKYLTALDKFQAVKNIAKENYITLDPERTNTINFYIIGCMMEDIIRTTKDQWKIDWVKGKKDYHARISCNLIIDYTKNGGKNPKQFYYIGHLLYNNMNALGSLADTINKMYGSKIPFTFFKKYESTESVALLAETNTVLLLGHYYLEEKDTATAMQYLLRELDLLNNNKHSIYEFEINDIVYEIAAIYVNQNNIPGLISILPSVKVFPFSKVNGYVTIARSYVEQSDFKNALFYLEAAFSTNASNKMAVHYGHYGLSGYIYYKLNRKAEALADFTKSIEIQHYQTDSYYFRGLLNEELGNHIEACADLSKAKKYNTPYYISMEDIDNACKKCSKKLLK